MAKATPKGKSKKATKQKTKPAAKPVELSDVDRFYIEGHMRDMSCEDMIAALGKPDALVRDYYHKVYENMPKEGPKKAGDLMARNDKRGVVTMTKEASLRAEEQQKDVPKKKNARFESSIYRIKP